MAGSKQEKKNAKPVTMTAYELMRLLGGGKASVLDVSQGPSGVHVHVNGKAYKV